MSSTRGDIGSIDHVTFLARPRPRPPDGRAAAGILRSHASCRPVRV